MKKAGHLIHSSVEKPTVPCRWCKTPTTMTGTEMCDPCWGLKNGIEHNPVVARRMLEAFKKGRKL